MGEELFKSGSGSVDHLVVAGWTDMNKIETMSFKLWFFIHRDLKEGLRNNASLKGPTKLY